MSPENNSDLSDNSGLSAPAAVVGNEVLPASPPSSMISPDSADATAPASNDSPSDITQTPAETPPKANVQKPKKSHFKSILLFLIVIVLIAGSSAGAFLYGKSKRIVATPTIESAKPINLPPEAIVTSECTPGRGKQYIIPKDIPIGPTYDVKSSKVIAIEYLIGMKALLTNSDSFSSTVLLLTKNYPVDHFAVVPATPKAGDTDQYINLIMFVVSKTEANSITCGAAATTTTDTTATTPTQAQ